MPLKNLLQQILPPILAVLASFIVCSLLLLLAGHDPIAAYTTLFRGAFGNNNRIAETLIKATPLLIMGLGVSVAFKAQVWNLGLAGQFTAGSIGCLYLGTTLNLPPILLLPISLLGSIICAGLLGALIGFLREHYNTSEVISTIMFNYIMAYLLSYLLRGPLMDPAGFGFPQTKLLPETMRLGILLEGTRLHYGLFLALFMTLLMLAFWRTRLGFSINLVGENPEFANYCGVKVPLTSMLTMFISAAFAGVAAWIEIYGLHFRLLDDIVGSLGTVAVVVALLGGLNPLGIALASLFFAALVTGGNTMQRLEGVPYSLVDIMLGLMVIFVISRSILQWKQSKN